MDRYTPWHPAGGLRLAIGTLCQMADVDCPSKIHRSVRGCWDTVCKHPTEDVLSSRNGSVGRGAWIRICGALGAEVWGTSDGSGRGPQWLGSGVPLTFNPSRDTRPRMGLSRPVPPERTLLRANPKSPETPSDDPTRPGVWRSNLPPPPVRYPVSRLGLVQLEGFREERKKTSDFHQSRSHRHHQGPG